MHKDTTQQELHPSRQARLPASPSRTVRRRVSFGLWLLYAAFLARVAGQALVALNLAPWLPPFAKWQSGLMPYPMLVCCQTLILIAFAKVAGDITKNSGYFSVSRPQLGQRLRFLALIYFAIMSLRFALFQFFVPELSNLAPVLPTIFHFVLALFILLVGNTLDAARRPAQLSVPKQQHFYLELPPALPDS